MLGVSEVLAGGFDVDDLQLWRSAWVQSSLGMCHWVDGLGYVNRVVDI